MTPETPEVVGVPQALRMLGISRPTLFDWLDKGRFPNAFKPDRKWLIPVSDIENLKKASSVAVKRPQPSSK